MDQTAVGHGFLLAANLTNSMQNLPDLPHTLNHGGEVGESFLLLLKNFKEKSNYSSFL